MSQFRHRHNLTSPSLAIKPHPNHKKSFGARSNFSMTPKPNSNAKTDRGQQDTCARTCDETVYNKNVHRFRDIFNQNDRSQLPFMSSLHNHPKNNQPLKTTISEAFEVSLKSTCNQTVRKKISDFKCQSRRLATSYYRWHNQTGRNNLWSTQFECSLRYPRDNASERNYHNYVKPIVYQDHPKKSMIRVK